MKTGFGLAAATLLALTAGAPALADDDWDRGDRKRWQTNERSEAYRDGYRDGRRAQYRAESRNDRWRQARGPSSWQPYTNGSRWDRDNRSVDRDYRYDNRYPAYRGASVNGSSPYWWGSNGQVQCRRQDGTTGLVVGALAGGTLGNVIAREGDKRLGSVIGGTLGAVLGNELARGNVRCR
jgi:hypothetical protein